MQREGADLIKMGWKADSDGMGLEALFTFLTFAKAAVSILLACQEHANISRTSSQP